MGTSWGVSPESRKGKRDSKGWWGMKRERWRGREGGREEGRERGKEGEEGGREGREAFVHFALGL